MIKIRDKYSFVLEAKDKEKGGGISETQPDDTMSIQEIIKRFVVDRQALVDARRAVTASPGEGEPDFDSEDLNQLYHADLSEKFDERRSSLGDRTAQFEAQEKAAKLKAAKKAKAAKAKALAAKQSDPKKPAKGQDEEHE